MIIDEDIEDEYNDLIVLDENEKIISDIIFDYVGLAEGKDESIDNLVIVKEDKFIGVENMFIEKDIGESEEEYEDNINTIIINSKTKQVSQKG